MIALAFVYVGLVVLGLVIAIQNRPLLYFRIAAVCVIPALAFAVWQAAQPPTGWPATGSPPQGQLIGGYVVEPDALTHNPGEIELWLVPSGSPRPRSYRIPYTRRTHEQVMAAMAAARHGVRVAVKMVGHRRGDSGPKVQPRFYRMPPPRLPTKNN